MLGEAIPTTLPHRLIIAVDAFGFADPEVGAARETPRVLSERPH
jgi:amidase